MTVIVPATGVSLDSLIIALRDGEWLLLTHALASHSDWGAVQVDLPKFPSDLGRRTQRATQDTRHGHRVQ